MKLRYPNIGWYISNNSGNEQHLADVTECIESVGMEIVGQHSQELSYGAGANIAWQGSGQYGDLTLWLEDDWALQRPLDIAPYANFLMGDPAIGMIRLAQIPINLHSETVGYNSQIYLKLKKNITQYYFSGNPSLRHSRFFDFYGPYPEGYDPGHTEMAYDAQIQKMQTGPEIVVPVDIGTWGFFGHIGTEPSYSV